MKTRIILEVEHSKEIPGLALMIEHRVYTLDGVEDTVAHKMSVVDEPLRELLRLADESDSAGYGTLSTRTVRNLVLANNQT